MRRVLHPSHRVARPRRSPIAVAAFACLSLTALAWLHWSASAMDLVRAETGVDQAVTTYGATGQGVVVAILDRGIDWQNQDFRNDDGMTRIKYIFDLTDNAGAAAPDNTYGRGTIYTEAQINAALAGGPPLATRDAVGHGTTTAGIAAGNGRNLASRKYRGVAPNASLIVVKVVSEGAPAHDSEPAEAPFNDATAYPVAIDFVRDKAAELGLPAVMLLNLGSINGPTDGTSALARKIDASVGPGKPGLVFVTGAGDDGGAANHAGGNLAQGQTASIQVQKGAAGTLTFDLWYPGSDRLDVTLQTPLGTFGPFASPATNDDEDFQQAPSAFNYFHKGTNKVFYGAQNGKREVFVQLTGPAGTYTVQLQAQTVAGSGRFDATINPSTFKQPPAQANRFLNFVVTGSIWDGATALNNITPNSYVVRNEWTDIDGVPRSITGEGAPGEMWPGSSTGPTFDGRTGVDVSVPGNSVFTTYAPKSHFATFRSNLIQDGGGFYGRADAVSAAAPQVTGIIALMLEKNRNLDAAQVRQMLRQTARTDSFTGATPNPVWGFGKVDAAGAVQLAAQSAATPTPTLTPTPTPACPTVVTSTSDGGAGSLREALGCANSTPGADVVNFDLPGPGPHTIQLASALPAISESASIANTSGESVTVRGEGASDAYRIFTINAGQVIQISNLNITNGRATGDGGAIYSQGALTLTGCAVYGNSAQLSGGGIRSDGTLNVTNSTISGNTAEHSSGGGGGIFEFSGTLTVTNSTVAFNTANSGGGIFNFNSNSATATLRSSVFANNTAPTEPDLFGNFTSQGFNLISRRDGPAIK